MNFEFSTATRIVFGPGTVKQMGPAARALGRSALLVSGVPAAMTAAMVERIKSKAMPCTVFPVTGEPTIQLVREGVLRAQGGGCDVVVAAGGGSAIDTGKAIAILLTNGGDALDYAEVVGRGKVFDKPAAPFIAVPTTAGAGAEVTRNAVLTSPDHRVKISLRHPHMLPRLALIDPELTYDLPPEVTAATGMDALSQLIEPFVSLRANPMTDALCWDGLVRAVRALPRVVQNGHDIDARADMALAALYSGMALANAGLGAVHGLAAPIGGMFKAPHGAVCAALLPHVIEINVRALRQRLPDSPILFRYDEVAKLLTDSGQATSNEGVLCLRRLVADLRIPPLGRYGITPAAFPALVEKAAAASSIKSNPVALSAEELTEILSAAV